MSKTGKGWCLALLTLMVLGFFSTASAQTGPSPADLAKNGGTFGKPPAGPPAQAVTTELKPIFRKLDDPKKKVKPLLCGDDFEVSVELTQAVKNCEGFKSAELLTAAQKEADTIINGITCVDDTCMPHTWYSYIDTHCTGKEASAKVNQWITCASEGQTDLKSGYYMPSTKEIEDDLASGKAISKGKDEDPGDSGEAVTQVFPTPLVCGAKPLLICDTSKFKTPVANFLKTGQLGLSPVKDFSVFYNEAVAHAELYYNLFTCADPKKCKKVPFAVTYATWSASDDEITVDVYFEVVCR